MQNISKHITLKEAISSPTAVRLGISNAPDKETLERMKKVAERCFEPLREWYGKPIRINSFYRSQELNKAIGGSETSEHCFGEAIDIDAGADNKKLFYWIVNNLDFSQCISEFGTNDFPEWIHISYTERKPNRNQVLRATKDKNGKTIYTNL